MGVNLRNMLETEILELILEGHIGVSVKWDEDKRGKAWDERRICGG